MFKSKNISKSNLPKLNRLIKPVAIACHADESSGVYIILKLRDRFGKVKKKMISASDAINLPTLKKILVENNLSPSMELNYYKKLQAIVLQHVDARVTLVRKPGFYGEKYILPNNKIIGMQSGEQFILDPNNITEALEIGKKGTLDDWQDNVAIYATHSSRLMLGLSSGFSAYLLNIINMENGGFHLYGMSSSGKTTTLYGIASINPPVSD